MNILQAFLAAWKEACKAPGATLKLPAKFKFLIKPITLQGPCMPHITLQVCDALFPFLHHLFSKTKKMDKGEFSRERSQMCLFYMFSWFVYGPLVLLEAK